MCNDDQFNVKDDGDIINTLSRGVATIEATETENRIVITLSQMCCELMTYFRGVINLNYDNFQYIAYEAYLDTYMI